MKRNMWKLRDELLRLGRKYIPRPVFEFLQPAYHFLLALAGAVLYGFPSRKMIVIGVTGTKGKTTACNLIAHTLQASGYKTGMTTTVNFRIGDEVWMNESKQTMLGRFQLQRLLRQMANAGCRYAVVETASEGILQFRHTFIDYDIAVFLNLSPEHLDRHKGFENYRDAKVKLFRKVGRKKNGIGVFNLDDENVEWFLRPHMGMRYGYAAEAGREKELQGRVDRTVAITNMRLHAAHSEFEAEGKAFDLPLIGAFNVANAGAAICVALSCGIPMEQVQKALGNFAGVPGRMETIDTGKKGFAVVVDYAHEPKSLEAVYKAITDSGLKREGGRLICVLGAAGGGRDKWKRPVMGKIAAHYCDEIVLTNEDPYDEDPKMIIKDIRTGIEHETFIKGNIHEIVDRREAIRKAIALARPGDAVVFTGKGGEQWMCIPDERRIPWNERRFVEEALGGK